MPFDPAIRQIIAYFRRADAWDATLDVRLLRALWPRIVGEGLARATSVVDVRDSRLTLRVRDETWKRQLIATEGWLLQKVNEPWPSRWITSIGYVYEDLRN
jgi:predicted nucleic acid-binding Zn ribbon protein